MTQEQVQMILQFITENNVLWLILLGFGMWIIGRSVPQATVEKLKADAAKTETPVDDALAAILEMLNGMRQPVLETPPQPSPNSERGTYVDELERLKNAPIEGEAPTIIRQPLGVPVNNNPTLGNVVTSGDWGDEGKRAKDTPSGYHLTWQPLIAGDKFAPPPETHYKHGQGLEFSLTDRRGRLLLMQHVDQLVMPGQRYLLAVRCACDLKLKPDVKVKGAITVKGTLMNNEAVFRGLSPWSPNQVEDLTGDFEALWALETGHAYRSLAFQIVIEVGNVDSVPFGEQSKLTIKAIELIPVAADYGNENLVRF